jgi:hypothetical protein
MLKKVSCHVTWNFHVAWHETFMLGELTKKFAVVQHENISSYTTWNFFGIPVYLKVFCYSTHNFLQCIWKWTLWVFPCRYVFVKCNKIQIGIYPRNHIYIPLKVNIKIRRKCLTSNASCSTRLKNNNDVLWRILYYYNLKQNAISGIE